MKEEKAITLINKYNHGGLTPEEEVRLNEWYLLTVAESKDELSADQIAQIVDLVRARLPLQAPVKKIKLWPLIVAAAAVVLLVAGVYFFSYNGTTSNDERSIIRDLKPGSVGATLTLADGKKIKLGAAMEGEIAKQAGVTVTKSADGQLVYTIPRKRSKEKEATNILSTAKGESYEIGLPDGSKVWLNSASSLTYTANLIQHGERKVKLDGEGYFEIAKNKSLPFVVETNKQHVTVLGTHFNINSYSDDPVTKTTLLEGSLRIEGNKKRIAGHVLKPGQQAISDGSVTLVKQASLEEAVAWKNGYFRFDNEPIQSVMKKLSRWYNIDVYYEGGMSNESFNGKISRNNNLSQVLNALESTKTIHFKIEGRRVTVIQ